MAYDGHLSFDTKIDEKGFTSGVSKLGSIAKGGLQVLTGAIAGVTSVMGVGISAGMKYNADMQMYMSNFETMLGGQEIAVDFVNKLKETAAKTPFEMSDLANASKTLLAFGSDADNANDQIKMLGDISLGNAQKLQTLSTAFGRIQSNGRASMEEINMMIDSGFNPLNLIAEKTGESMDDLRKRVSKGGVSFEEINEAMLQATSAGGQFYQGMEKASQTLDGQMSTLRDNAMSLLGEVVQPLTDEMTNSLLPAAISAIDQLSEAFREGGVDGFIQAGADIVANLIAGLASQIPSIISTAISFIDVLIQSLSESMPTIVSAGGQLILSLISGIVQLLPSVGMLGLSIIQSIVEGIAGSLGQISPSGQSVVAQFIIGITQKIPEVIASGSQIINGFVERILSSLPQMLSSGAQIVRQIVSGIASNAQLAAAEMGKLLVQLVATIASHLPELLQKGIELIGQLIAGSIASIPDVLAGIGEVCLSIIDAIRDTDWLSLGKDIMAGIGNGILNGAKTVIDAAKSAAKDALDAAKNFLGIHSPSRVFRDEVGKNIALGIGDGILKNAEYAKKSAEEISRAVLDSAKDSINPQEFPHTNAVISDRDMAIAINAIESCTSTEAVPSHVYGNEGYGPGSVIDYGRMGEEMRDALNGVNVSMDGKSVGEIVSEPVNDNFGNQGRREERDMV